jgi:hypothetical protein
MHSSGAVWLSEWVGKIQNSGETAVGSLDCVIEGSLGNFEDDFAGRYVNYFILKKEKTILILYQPKDTRRIYFSRHQKAEKANHLSRGWLH